ncbi:unnamed protein product [Gadus morhua 'NCC']
MLALRGMTIDEGNFKRAYLEEMCCACSKPSEQSSSQYTHLELRWRRWPPLPKVTSNTALEHGVLQKLENGKHRSGLLLGQEVITRIQGLSDRLPSWPFFWPHSSLSPPSSTGLQRRVKALLQL